jgi:hypothetical protein
LFRGGRYKRQRKRADNQYHKHKPKPFNAVKDKSKQARNGFGLTVGRKLFKQVYKQHHDTADYHR